MPITLSSINDQTTAIGVATGALVFTVSRSPIVAEVEAGAYLDTLDEIDLGTDVAALGIEVGSLITGYGIPAGAVVDSIAGNIVTSDLSFTDDGDGSDLTFDPPVSGVTVTAFSYDYVRISSVVLGGSGASRTVTVTPATGRSGVATIVVNATTVGGEESSITFLLTITPASSGYTIPATWIDQELGPVIEVASQGIQGTLKYMAPYPTCLSSGHADYRPNYGVRIAGLVLDMVVGSVKIEPLSTEDTGHALVTISLIPPEKAEETDSEGEPIEATYRCHWENELKPLHTATLYMPGGTKALTEADLVDVEMWKSEPDPALRKVVKYKDANGVEVTLSTNAKHLAAKLLRGTENYPFSYPVVTKSGLSRVHLSFAPTINKYYNAPPGFPANTYPPGWIWVGVEDDREQQGRTGPKERAESYRGVNAVDKDLYVAG